MHRGSARSNNNAVNIFKNGVIHIIGAKIRQVIDDAGTDSVAESLRLFMDFFHHKIIIAAFFGRSHIPAYMMDMRPVNFKIFVFDDNFIFGDFGDMPLF